MQGIKSTENADISVGAYRGAGKKVAGQVEPAPNVAEVPRAQNIPQGMAPSMRVTCDAVAVVKVVPIWKTKSGLDCRSPSRVSTPVKVADLSKQ
jgi:hypothetical protein